MDIEKLFTGIAVIIDDEVEDKGSSIGKILKQIDYKKIPYLKYTELPDAEIIKHLKNVSFILLDWRLHKIDELGVNIPEGLDDSDVNDNINFLKDLKKVCFCPVFIFSNEDVESIKDKLQSNGLYSKDKCGMFLIRAKNDFIGDGSSLFFELEKWLKENAPIYLLKEWESSYADAKTKLFIDFQKRSSDWPKYLWQTYNKDEVNPSVEFAEFISRSLESQMQPFDLDKDVFETQNGDENIDELKACLERQCFITKDFLVDETNTGDLFFFDNKYYVNIRPSCDLIKRKDDNNTSEIELYLLEGDAIKKHDLICGLYDIGNDNFTETVATYRLYPICKKLLTFYLKKLSLRKWSEIKDKRVGRILPPYITKLQMKYASYLQRQGLPRLPDVLFNKVEE